MPTNDKQLWIKLLHLDLEAHPPLSAILAVGLRAEPGSTSKVQLGLFSPQLPEAGRLDITLARLSALVGEGDVGSPALPDQQLPGSFRIEPFTLPSGDATITASPMSRVSLRQLRPPEPVAVTLKDGGPRVYAFAPGAMWSSISMGRVRKRRMVESRSLRNGTDRCMFYILN